MTLLRTLRLLSPLTSATAAAAAAAAAVSFVPTRNLAVPRHPNRIAEDWKKLNDKIKATAHDRKSTLHDLLLLYDRQNRHMGPMNVSSLLIYLAHLAQRRGQETVAKHERYFDHLARRAFDLLPVMSPTSLADVALAYSLLFVTEVDPLDRLWKEIEPVVEKDFLPGDLTKLTEALYNFQLLKTGNPNLRNPAFLYPSADELNQLPLPLDTLLPKIHTASVDKISLFLPQHLVQMARHLALLESSSSPKASQFFEEAEKIAVPKIYLFTADQMETLAWAFAKSGRKSEPLLEAIRHQGKLLRVSFNDLN